MLRSRIFLCGQAVSMLGDGLALLAVPLLVLQLTRSPMAAVLAALPGSVGYLVAGLPAGVVIDRLNPWLVLICCDLVRGGIFVVLFMLTGSRAVTAWLVLALAFAAGAVTVFADTALAVIVRDVFAGPRLISANSWLESANQGGQIIGPGLAGLLASAGLLHVSMLIDAVTFGVSLATLTWVRRAAGNAAHAGGPGREPVRWRAISGELAAGLRYLAATRLLLTLLIFMLVLNLGLGADKLIVFLARDTLHLSPGTVGLVVTAGGAGGLAGAVTTSLLGRLIGPLRTVWAGAALSGVALLLLSAATSAGLASAASALYSWAIIVASVMMRSLRQVLVPRELLGRVTASWRLGGQGVTFCGALLAGAIAAASGGDPRPVLAGAGLLTLGTAGLAWWLALRRADVPAALLTGPPARSGRPVRSAGRHWREPGRPGRDDQSLHEQAHDQIEQDGRLTQSGQVLVVVEQGVVAKVGGQREHPQDRREHVALGPRLAVLHPHPDRHRADEPEHRREHQAPGQRPDRGGSGVVVRQVLVGLDHADDAQHQEQPLVDLADRLGAQAPDNQQPKDRDADDEIDQRLT